MEIAAERAQNFTALELAVDTALDELEKNLTEPQQFVGPNNVIQFGKKVNDFRIGPVRAVRMAVLEAELTSTENGRVAVTALSKPVFKDGRATDERVKPDSLWVVELGGSKKNIKEQAVWLVDVALGIIRIALISGQSEFLEIGLLEADPFLEPFAWRSSVVLRKSGMRMLGNTGSHVRIDSDVSELISAGPYDNYKQIFEAKKGSVGERVAQGLGWMTRARQTPDRAERLLFFFTAIEALLTNDDKTAPITQTIARHAGVILSNEANERSRIASELKKLYASRSALVHAGKRAVTRSNADSIQSLTESLYIRVLENVDLASDFQKFNGALSAASYGGPWP